ncbi:MAG: YlcI/YnfO family protein [Burkholderiales bacterium]
MTRSCKGIGNPASLHYKCNAMEHAMKTAAIPAVRVSPELREAAEVLLGAGETLSGFVEESVRRNVEFRQSQKALIERGLASAEAARKSGKYVSAAAMLAKLDRRIEKARKERSPTR